MLLVFRLVTDLLDRHDSGIRSCWLDWVGTNLFPIPELPAPPRRPESSPQQREQTLEHGMTWQSEARIEKFLPVLRSREETASRASQDIMIVRMIGY